MPSSDHWYLFSRHVSGDATEAEEEALRTWIGRNPTRRALLERVQALYEAGGEEAVEAIDVDAAWQRLSRQIKEEPELQKLHRRADRRPTVGDRRRRARWRIGAAVLAALVLVSLPWLSPESEPEEPWQVVETSFGEQATVELTDGSVIQLNADSRIRYPSEFDAEEREVEIEGEAYVEAASMEDWPLVVSFAAAPHVEVRVLGTSFLARGYAEDDYARVAVSEGTVSVASSSSSPEVLNANDVAEVDADGEFRVARGVDLTAHLSWLEGRLVFEDTPLREALAAIGRRYNVTIQPEDAALSERTITASIGRNDTLDEVLEVLARTLDLRIERAEEGIFLRSTAPSE